MVMMLGSVCLIPFFPYHVTSLVSDGQRGRQFFSKTSFFCGFSKISKAYNSGTKLVMQILALFVSKLAFSASTNRAKLEKKMQTAPE